MVKRQFVKRLYLTRKSEIGKINISKVGKIT